jgi:hypothetical protein
MDTMITPAISDDDRKTLVTTHQKLLENRQAMMDGLTALSDAPHRRGLLVDGIISGLMDHFTEVAKNTPNHQKQIEGWGPKFSDYVSRTTEDITGMFTLILPSLQQQAAKAAAPEVAQGRERVVRPAAEA